MKKLFALIALAALVLPVSVFAEDDADIFGFAEGRLRMVAEKDGGAKFQEYRDLDDGGTGSFYLNVNKKSYSLEFEGDNVGRDDQYYLLQGGDFRNYGYRMFYNETPHNLSFDARTIYSNPGSANLNYGATNRAKNTDASYTHAVSRDRSTWTRIDYAVDRKDYGGEMRLTLNSPYFLNFGAKQQEKTGLKPLGQPSGVFHDRTGSQTSPFGNIVEMPEPVDYKTLDAFVETGYRSKKLTLAVKASMSDFRNDHQYLTWRNPYVSTESYSETSSLPPDNKYYKLSFDGSMHLPLNSLLAVRVAYSRLKNDFWIRNTIASATSGTATTTPTYSMTNVGINRERFDGDVTYKKVGLSLSTRPLQNLFGKVYYNSLDKNNDSSVVIFSNAGSSNINHIFDYDKKNAGGDLDYKLPLGNTASVGYDYLVINRDREDAAKTTDHTVYVELKNDYLDTVSGKIRYQRLMRKADFEDGDAGTDATDARYILRFVRPFDATDKTEDKVKLGLEFYPTQNLDLGLEYGYKVSDYDETTLGRTDDKGHEVYADVMWRPGARVSITGFGGFEKTSVATSHRNISPTSPVNTVSMDPAAGTVVTGTTLRAYNWDMDTRDAYWVYGVSTNIEAVPSTLNLVFSWQQQQSDGKVTFTSPVSLEKITDSDDYIHNVLEAKAIYKFTRNIDVTLGLLHEKHNYDDTAYNGYNYTVASSAGVVNSFLSGAYADHDYEEYLSYFSVRYNF